MMSDGEEKKRVENDEEDAMGEEENSDEDESESESDIIKVVSCYTDIYHNRSNDEYSFISRIKWQDTREGLRSRSNSPMPVSTQMDQDDYNREAGMNKEEVHDNGMKWDDSIEKKLDSKPSEITNASNPIEILPPTLVLRDPHRSKKMKESPPVMSDVPKRRRKRSASPDLSFVANYEQNDEKHVIELQCHAQIQDADRLKLKSINRKAMLKPPPNLNPHIDKNHCGITNTASNKVDEKEPPSAECNTTDNPEFNTGNTSDCRDKLDETGRAEVTNGIKVFNKQTGAIPKHAKLSGTSPGATSHQNSNTCEGANPDGSFDDGLETAISQQVSNNEIQNITRSMSVVTISGNAKRFKVGLRSCADYLNFNFNFDQNSEAISFHYEQGLKSSQPPFKS